MIAEEFKSPQVCNSVQESAAPGGPGVEPAPRPGREIALNELAAQIRADASEDAIFYLVRSNTSYDGE